MFFFTYLRRELRRRFGRTFLTVLGLALGVGLVASITAVSNGLDAAQQQVLDPLATVGTDLVVSRPVGTSEQNNEQSQRGPATTGPGGGFLGPSGLTREDQQALLAENQSVITDLSKLGNPGEKFVHDFFLPATQLTFPAEQLGDVSKIPGVANVAGGLTLVGVHQEGTVPQIVAEIQTGGETIDINEPIAPPTAEEQQQMEACRQRAAQSGGGPESFANCLPERLRQFRGRITTPQRTLRQALDPPQTDITSQTYTIAGVDLSADGLGLLTKDQITKGSFLSTVSISGGSKNEAILAEGYAGRTGRTIGSELNLNGTIFKVIGFAKSPLGGQTADVYLTLHELQKLSGREGRLNTLYVRGSDASKVSAIEDEIKDSFEGSQVTSSEDVADRVSGSLVDAANLTDRLGFIVAIVVLVAAFGIASLLSLSSVTKRVRELGTLKAIGWRTRRVVRQVLGESLAQGILGGVLGLGLGFAAAYAISAFAPPLEASASGAPNRASGLFGLGNVSTTSEQSIALQASIDMTTVALALGLAILGGVIAGVAAAARAARLRPAAALREIG